jgi:hypothetical protein
MKNSYVLAIEFWVAMSAIPVRGQGTFENLNFEQAMPAQFSGPVSAAQAIPDWTAEIAGAPQTDIYQNGFSTGAPEISLMTENTQQPPLDGSYSVMLTANPQASVSISQTGMIAPGTQSLLFDAYTYQQEGNLAVMIGSQTVPLALVAIEPNYSVYGANISAWAGQYEQLTFTAQQPMTSLNIWEIDDISFSPGAVPEPSALALTGIGGLLFALYQLFAPKRR